MNIIYFMIGATFILIAGFVAAFLWAARDGQFDDLTTPAFRMLQEDNPKNLDSKEIIKTQSEELEQKEKGST